MKIKRFVAATMREALAQVRAEQGSDAVIITNRRVDGGIELITAIDYDEALIAQALQRPRPASPPAAGAAGPAAAPRPEPAVDPAATLVLPAAAAVAARAVAHAPATPAKGASRSVVVQSGAQAPAAPAAVAAPPAPAQAPARPQVVWSQDAGLVAMRREVEGLRELLQDQLASLAWSDRLRREPVRARVLRDLTELGIAADVARQLAERVPEGAAAREAWRLALALLMKHVPTTDDGLLEQGGTFAIVGPTGVGKTTTIAKLAARYALRHGAREVALVSLDHYRIGARDQLLTFARILGVPLHVVSGARELAGVLASLADRRLVLIDTAGMSPRDDRLAAQFAALSIAGQRIRALLALAANAEHLALDGVARSYAAVRPEAIVLTKLDEAASFGPALSVAMRHGLPLARLCDGQRVPEDLHAAPPKRLWLVKQARRLAEQGRALAGMDEAAMAERFGRAVRHG